MKWENGREEVQRTFTRLYPSPLGSSSFLPFLVVVVLMLLVGGGGLLLTLKGGERPALLVEGAIVDGETGQPLVADVYLDGRLLYEGVSTISVWVPSGSELWVEAPGYHSWGLRFRYELRGAHRLRGPIRLKAKVYEESRE